MKDQITNGRPKYILIYQWQASITSFFIGTIKSFGKVTCLYQCHYPLYLESYFCTFCINVHCTCTALVPCVHFVYPLYLNISICTAPCLHPGATKYFLLQNFYPQESQTNILALTIQNNKKIIKRRNITNKET